MAEAIFGLVGVVVGAALTTGAQAVFRWRDAKRLRRKAARLLRDELSWVRIGAEAIERIGDRFLADTLQWNDPQPLLALWKAEREFLVDLPYHDWCKLESPMRVLGVFGARMSDPDLKQQRGEAAVIVARDVRLKIDGAIEVLRAHVE